MKIRSTPSSPISSGSTAASIRKATTLAQNILKRGDSALRSLTKQKDTRGLEVDGKELASAMSRLRKPELRALELACGQIGRYARRQLASVRPFVIKPTTGSSLSQEIRPLPSVGIILGPPPAPSLDLMLGAAIPAALAGVGSRIACAETSKEGRLPDAVMAAAHMTEVSSLFKLPAQAAMAALALGGTSLPKVDLIVARCRPDLAAMRQVLSTMSTTDIRLGFADELLVICDQAQWSELAVAELCAHLERQTGGVCGFLTWDEKVHKEIFGRMRSWTARRKEEGTVYVTQVRNLSEAVDLANQRPQAQIFLLLARPELLAQRLVGYSVLHVGPEATPSLFTCGLGPPWTLQGAGRMAGVVSVTDFLTLGLIHTITREGGGRLNRAGQILARMEQRGLSEQILARRLETELKTGSRR